MEKEFHLLYPPGFQRSQDVPMKDYKFIKSLQINEMVVLVKESFRGMQDLSLEDYFSTNPVVLEYRLAVVEDLIQHRELYDVFCRSISIIHNINELKHARSGDYTIDSTLSAVRSLEMYQEIVDLFADALRGTELSSEGMRQFQRQILEIADGEEYQNLQTELSKMEMKLGNMKSVTIGLNLDENLCPKEAGVLSVNQTPFKSGDFMAWMLKKRNADTNTLMNALFPLTRGLKSEEWNSMNFCISESLEKIFKKALRDFESIVHNYYNVNTAIFSTILNDIRFLTAGVKFILEMSDRGYPMCKPGIATMEEKKCEIYQLYNPMLAQKELGDTLVSNSYVQDSEGRFFLITGPNHGGKSIFAYSIGMAQALFQLGLFVPAESAVLSPVSGIFTHFPTSDENNYGKGRLESECERLGEIMKKLSDTDMLLMDESFSSTSGLEAGYIASEVLTGIGIIGCGGAYVTHIHDLPLQVEEYNAHPDNRGKIDNLVAQMENKSDGTRSYKITRTKPDGLSYARDIASRYGLDLNGILANKKG